MDKCSTGVCIPVESWMENKPLIIGIAILAVALIVGVYFWWRSRSSSAASASEPVTEEFVGRQGATREEFEAAQRAVQAQAQAQQPEEEHEHQE